VHGISSGHAAWPPVARELLKLRPDALLLAPDVRGRGLSRDVAGPYGMVRHTADLLAVLDAAGVERAVLCGHSMGAWAVARLAAEHPDRAHGVVLVDGGVNGPPPEDGEAAVERVLGPAVERLRMHFNDDGYLHFWRHHPAFGAGRFNDDVARWALIDLEGDRPRAREEAVRADMLDLLLDPDTRAATSRVRCHVHLLRAERGLLDEVPPFLPDTALAGYGGRLTEMRGVNHYTATLGAGAPLVAEAVAQALPAR
jgi:pimeloyl-ACP methyl ester carboxylesterase